MDRLGIEWTSDWARRRHDQIQKELHARADKIFGAKIVAHLVGQYHDLQRQYLTETEDLRKEVADLVSLYTVPKATSP